MLMKLTPGVMSLAEHEHFLLITPFRFFNDRKICLRLVKNVVIFCLILYFETRVQNLFLN